MKLEQRVVAIHDALAADRIPHAFGGAIALAYWIKDPRGTSDIDVNIFAPALNCEQALAALPSAIEQPPGTADRIHRDGQIRLWWEGMPVDLFFDYVPVHFAAAQNATTVPFEDTEIPILGPIELLVFKAMFDRTKDWADIEAMIAAGTVDLEAARKFLSTMLGNEDPRFDRLDEAVIQARRL